MERKVTEKMILMAIKEVAETVDFGEEVTVADVIVLLIHSLISAMIKSLGKLSLLKFCSIIGMSIAQQLS